MDDVVAFDRLDLMEMSLSDQTLLIQLLCHSNKNRQVERVSILIFKHRAKHEVDTEDDGICKASIERNLRLGDIA